MNHENFKREFQEAFDKWYEDPSVERGLIMLGVSRGDVGLHNMLFHFFSEGSRVARQENKILNGVAFSDIIPEFRVLTDKDKVRKNTANDYDLPMGWYFSAGIYIEKVWTLLYVRPLPDIVSQMTEGRIAGPIELVKLIRTPENGMCLMYRDRHMGRGRIIATNITDIPENVMTFFNPNWYEPYVPIG